MHQIGLQGEARVSGRTIRRALDELIFWLSVGDNRSNGPDGAVPLHQKAQLLARRS